jgi:hypothetical protein
VSRDGGRTFTARPGRDGAPIPAVPAGLVAEAGAGGVGAFDPGAGQWHPLAGQPRGDLLSVVTAGRALYAATRQGGDLLVSRSGDAGRTWTATTVTRADYKTPALQLVAGTDGLVYLVVTRPLPAGEPGVASVWRSTGTAAWSRLIDYADAGGGTPLWSTAVGAANGGVLLSDGTAGGELVFDTGRTVSFYAPPGLPGDPPLIPAVLRRGDDDPTGTIAGITADGWHLVVRHDHDVGWSVVLLPS